MSLARIDDYLPFREEPEIRRHIGVFRRRRALFGAVFLGTFLLGTAAVSQVPPAYRATAKLVVPPPAARAGRADPQTSLAEIEVAAAPRAISLSAQADEMMSEPSIDQALAMAGLPVKGGRPSVKVEAPDLAASDVLTVSVSAGNPKDAARLANAVARLHVERVRRMEQDGLRRAVTFMRREREQAAEKLEDARGGLEAFGRRYPLRQLNLQQEARSKHQSDLNARAAQERGSITSLEAQLEKHRRDLKREKPDVARRVTKDNPQRTLLQDRLRQLRVERLQLLKDFQPTSPEVEALDEQIRSFEGQLAAEPRAVQEITYGPNPRYQILETRVGELEAGLLSSREGYRAVLSEIESGPAARDYAAAEARQQGLSQNLTRAFERYNLISDRLQALEVRQNAQTSSTRVIQEAVTPKSPVMPYRPLLLLLAAALALVLALAVVFVSEQLDDRVQEANDLGHCLPTLGCVPRLGAPQGSILIGDEHDDDEDPRAIESYRALRSSIGFAGLDIDLRRIQVTSPTRGDGKSTNAVNLAIAMAMDGKQVVLVDADLRDPSLHTVLGLRRSPGLSDVLSGDQRVDLAVQQTGIPNLRLLPAGEPVKNATELLGTPNFRFVIEHLERSADYVIVDSPPCSVADPVVLSARMDGVILVVHVGKTRRGAVRQATEMLRRARARLLGIVYNGTRDQGGDASYSSWGSYHSDVGWERPGSHSRARGRGASYGDSFNPFGSGWNDPQFPDDWDGSADWGCARPGANGANGQTTREPRPRMLRPGRYSPESSDDEDRIA
jgi:polysaccharide biosynthesis transport protein